MNRLFRLLPACLALLVMALPAIAHDSWVQPHTPLTRTGDVAHIDLMLGNHGNHHRDFKLAGKVDPDYATLDIITPDGKRHDLKPSLADQGMDARTGYWAGSFPTEQSGLHLVAHTYDRVVHYAPARSIKSAKAFFITSSKLDKVAKSNPGFDRVLGHPLELVPLTDPITTMKPGQALRVKLLYQGKPLKDKRISFIPRGVTLESPTDEKYERLTDEEGIVSFAPDQANYFLIVVHHQDDTLQGQGYELTKFSATITLQVPALPLCDE